MLHKKAAAILTIAWLKPKAERQTRFSGQTIGTNSIKYYYQSYRQYWRCRVDTAPGSRIKTIFPIC